MNEPAPPTRPSRGLTLLLAVACGLTVANLYYAQPLAGVIGPQVGLSAEATGLVVTLSQLGYGAGLLLLAPLGDFFENRRLIVITLVGEALALGLICVSQSAPLFLTAALLVGLGAVATQMLVPVAAHMASEETRGRVVGEVMSGLLAGILLARPFASFVSDLLGWRAVFAISAALMLLLAGVLWRLLPQRRPERTQSYLALIGSLPKLFAQFPVLRRRGLYQACLFGVFTLFWTSAPLLLAGPVFGFSQRGIALFGLAGAAGVLVAPIAGRLGDRGLTRPATGVAMSLAFVAFLVGWPAAGGSLVALVAAALVLDAGVQMNQILGQRTVYALGTEIRSRLNGLYMAIMFTGGSVGSALAGLSFAKGGWRAASVVGLAMCAIAIGRYGLELARRET